jgi:hypothetical protein
MESLKEIGTMTCVKIGVAESEWAMSKRRSRFGSFNRFVTQRERERCQWKVTLLASVC